MVAGLGSKLVEYGQKEGRRFTGTCLSATYEVAARHDDRDGLLLNGSGAAKPHVVKPSLYIAFEIKILEIQCVMVCEDKQVKRE